VMSFHQKAITSIDPTTRKVSTDQGHYQADVLAVALGADRSTSPGGAGGWSPRRRMQLTSAPDGSTEPTTDATETHNGRKGTEKRCPLHPPKKPCRSKLCRRDRRHHQSPGAAESSGLTLDPIIFVK
jgi:hypothetical protein